VLGALVADVGVEVEEPAVEVERLLGVEEAVQVRLFREVADAFVLGDVRGGLAEEKALALSGEEQAEQQLDGGRLARTVGPEQAEDFALADLHGEGAQGGLLLSAPEVAVYLGELARLNDDIMGHGPAPRQRNQSGSPIRVIHPSTQRAR